MRVLHIGKFYPPFAGGMENFLGDLLPALKRIGVNAKALVHDQPSLRKRSCCNNISSPVYRVPCYGSLMYAPVSPGFPLVLNKFIHTFHPQILHLHLPNTSAFWAMTLACARRIPWVVHWHSDVVPSEIDRRLAVAYRLYRPVEQRLLQRTQTIVATSPSYLATSEALTPWRDKCRVVPLGLDAMRLKIPAEALKKWAEGIWQQKHIRVLAIGRLTYYKGHEVLIRAAAHVPGIRVLIVGEGDRKERLQSLIKELGLAERVELSGFMEETKLQALLASCDCLCLPSVERTEAFGLVLLEAMRYAKPVVASDVAGSGIGWVVTHGETGFLVPPGDASGLARALQAMAEKQHLRKSMGRAAKEQFNNFFQIDQVARKVISLYRDIVQ